MRQLNKLFQHAHMRKVRLGEAAIELGFDATESQDLLKEAIHYRLAVAPNLDYWDSLKECFTRLERSN